MNIRELYSFLRFLQDVQRTDSTATVEEMIVETKRKIRKLQHQRPVDPDFVLEHRIVRQYDDDGYVELILIDHSFGDQSDVRHYADDQIWIEARPSMYDCTGQHFSRWYSIFRTPRGMAHLPQHRHRLLTFHRTPSGAAPDKATPSHRARAQIKLNMEDITMYERYYAKDGKTYATVEGRLDDGRTLFCVYYDGWFSKMEAHELKLYEWAKHLHGNAPSGTPYGYFRASRNGKRIIVTV